VLPNREYLDSLDDDSLRGSGVTIAWGANQQRFTLIEVIGRGRTAVAWKAHDLFDRPYALKFVPRSEYETHSLDAEARRVLALPGDRFARIAYFGTAVADAVPNPFEGFYGILVDWIEGRTLRSFLGDPLTEVTPSLFRRLFRDLCEALQALRSEGLMHNDLHEDNITVRPRRDTLSGEETLGIVIIDSGQLKTDERRAELLELWRGQVSTLTAAECAPQSTGGELLKRIERLIAYFERTDQEWVVHHICTLYNHMRLRLPLCSAAERRFIHELPESIRRMADHDPSRRLDEPKQMYEEVERVWSHCIQPRRKSMTSPFDLPSAELIRSDHELMALFSDQYPRLDACRSNAPVYLYGPRGCGKSTILRSLSLRAILEVDDPAAALAKIPFTGIYISCSQELRSRFWLMKDADFEILDGHLVRYFTLLLIEGLVETFDRVARLAALSAPAVDFLFTADVAVKCAAAVRHRVGLDAAAARYSGTSHFVALQDEIRRARDGLWQRILDRSEPQSRPDAQLIFDLCHDLERIWPFLRDRRIAFLLDDYSNQRIPAMLQKKLNQAITFSKQGSPIFKVTSEYDGVDLEGVQEGREVHEVNVGFEYVSLQSPNRYRFLQNVLERRFAHLDQVIDLLDVLPLSAVEPTIPMARAIREAHLAKKTFYYHGLDTISDLCSGDFATGIDIVRRIFEQGRINWRKPQVVSPTVQDTAIREYSKQEFEYIRFHSRDGRHKYDIAERLCWLSKECVLTKDIEKDGNVIPVVKNHIDLADTVLRSLEQDYPEQAELFRQLVRRGVLFPLRASRSREGRGATERFMIRRILLARYTSALGQHVAIRIDEVQRMLHLLSEPHAFARDELARTSVQRSADASATVEPQLRLPFGKADKND